MLLIVGGLVAPASVAAESGDLNAHGSFAVGGPITGQLSAPDRDGNDRLIPAGWIGLDWQFERPWAVEALVGFGRQVERSNAIGATDQSFWSVQLGVRYRLFDDTKGYATEAAGNFLGNFWLSGHLGYYGLDDAEFGGDVGVGYEFSIARPFLLGFFGRAALVDGGGFDGAHLLLWGGIEASVALLADNAPRDRDGDGLSEEEEIALGTNPLVADSDGDGLNDRVESEGPTDALVRDTDHDGLSDGEEDVNENGRRDPEETDPLDRDTDDGGVPDGEEARGGKNPLDRLDDSETSTDADGDGVDNQDDMCPDTPRGASVRADGCETVGRSYSLEGVRFRTGRATILPASEASLRRSLELLTNNPEVRVEIGGHTDDRGRDESNQRLSERRAQAVRDWLVSHGVDAGRLEVRGYGETRPTASNATPQGRARNRRIEFRRLN